MKNSKPVLDKEESMSKGKFGGWIKPCAVFVLCAGVSLASSAQVKEVVLHSFTGTDGDDPYAGVLRDSAGTLYGTTSTGGKAGVGLAYKLDHSGTETVLHAFKSTGKAGCFPNGPLVRDSDGNLYGTTVYCGEYGGGAVYKVDSSGKLTVLHTFTPGNVCHPHCGDGFNPHAGAILDSAGNLYGTTYYGGTDATKTYGSVYEVTASGTERVLYGFKGADDGANPTAGVTRDKAGNLYGTTTGGGRDGNGIVFKLTP
jgi:uncharacterized repeat protein (TIGR03803 family)